MSLSGARWQVPREDEKRVYPIRKYSRESSAEDRIREDRWEDE
jgi:hypothetical protein